MHRHGYKGRKFGRETDQRTALTRGLMRSLFKYKSINTTLAKAKALRVFIEPLLTLSKTDTTHCRRLAFSKLMNKGSVIVDISSNSAYVLPKFLISRKVYALAETDEELFVKKLVKKSNLAKGEYQKSGFAYALSKIFVVWYAQKSAFEYGKKGIRVVSFSPGLIATGMGNLEAKEGGSMLKYGAEERMGTPAELGFAIATVADERNGYLAGVDVLCDGGCTNGKMFKK